MIYIATGHGEDFDDNLGVFDDYEDALQRCRDRIFLPSDYVHFYIETWELGADDYDVHIVTPNELVAKAASQ